MTSWYRKKRCGKREAWESLAENAYQLPDMQVLALIKEVRDLRERIRNQHGMGR